MILYKYTDQKQKENVTTPAMLYILIWQKYRHPLTSLCWYLFSMTLIVYMLSH